jgi:hypothetical protein
VLETWNHLFVGETRVQQGFSLMKGKYWDISEKNMVRNVRQFFPHEFLLRSPVSFSLVHIFKACLQMFSFATVSSSPM